ncbi:hypothetical protein BJX76DRAFT_361789 [Aspergillus varians]
MDSSPSSSMQPMGLREYIGRRSNSQAESSPQPVDFLQILLSLPRNVWQRIFSALDCRSVARFLRVCRDINTFATPTLYNHVFIHDGQVASFVRCFDTYPYLLDRVQYMLVHDHHTVDTTEAEALAPIISRLRNLNYLVIRGCYSQLVPGAGNLVDGHSRLYVPVFRSRLLTNLENLSLNLSLGESWDMADRECIFSHPTLRQLSILGAKMSDFHSFDAVMHGTTPLEQLNLYCCDLSSATLKKILAVPRALRSFAMMGARQLGAPEYTHSQHNLYLDAIAAHQSRSLRILELAFWKYNTAQPVPLDFHRFEDLRHLTISTLFIIVRALPVNMTPFMPDAFPRSLRTITLLHMNAHTIITTEVLQMSLFSALSRSGQLPRLQTLTFGSSIAARGGLGHDANPAARMALNDMGVEADDDDFTIDPTLVSLLSIPTWIEDAIDSAMPTDRALSFMSDIDFDSPSSSDSDADPSSVSTGGAPAVTGEVVMGLVGAAGILVLAIALWCLKVGEYYREM